MSTAKSLTIPQAAYDNAMRAFREGGSHYDYDLSNTAYVSFGLYGLTLRHIANAGRVLRSKYIPEWHKKSLRELNDELRRQQWYREV